MIDDILIEQESENKICYINARTRPLFTQMLNKLGTPVKIGSSLINHGDALYMMDLKSFDSLFNRWVSKCCEENIMVIVNDNSSTKYLKWSDELSEVEKAFKGMEVLKEII